jgi:hypothetical protein
MFFLPNWRYVKIYVLNDLSSFEYVENYSNDIIANWNVCEVWYELWFKCLTAYCGWDLNYANIDWWIDVLNGLLFYIESMCLRHEHESKNIVIEHGTWNKDNMDRQ